MPAHSFMEIGERLLLACGQSYLRALAALFTETELRDEGERYGYVSRVDQLRDRLQLQGFTAQRALDDLEAAVRVRHDRYPNPETDAMGVPVWDAAALLDELRTFLNSSDEWATYEEPEIFWQQLDARTNLRLALDVVDDQRLQVRYRLDDLVSRGFLDRGTSITEQAREERRENMARDAPLVVLTEGSSDSQLLTEAVRVTHPHLVGFLRFMDFSGGLRAAPETWPSWCGRL